MKGAIPKRYFTSLSITIVPGGFIKGVPPIQGTGGSKTGLLFARNYPIDSNQQETYQTRHKIEHSTQCGVGFKVSADVIVSLSGKCGVG
jgi:hypothetical protein